MRRALRENALCALMAGAGCATLARLGLYGFAWNDYDNEARPAFEALATDICSTSCDSRPPTAAR